MPRGLRLSHPMHLNVSHLINFVQIHMRMASSVCEEKVFDQVFETQGERLRNFLYYKCGDLELAEDFTQECFVKLWNNCAKVPLEKAKSFLFTIGNNLFLNHVKHKKVVLKFQQRQDPSDRSHESPEFLMEEQEFKERLEAAISALTENQRVVFLMNRIDKKTYKEIAETLGISQKAVEKRMSKALQSLRKLTKRI